MGLEHLESVELGGFLVEGDGILAARAYTSESDQSVAEGHAAILQCVKRLPCQSKR